MVRESGVHGTQCMEPNAWNSAWNRAKSYMVSVGPACSVRHAPHLATWGRAPAPGRRPGLASHPLGPHSPPSHTVLLIGTLAALRGAVLPAPLTRPRGSALQRQAPRPRNARLQDMQGSHGSRPAPARASSWRGSGQLFFATAKPHGQLPDPT